MLSKPWEILKLEDSKMLKTSQDAYGHQLYDFFRGRQVVEVVERDDGLIDPNESLPKYYLSEYRDWNPREKRAAAYVKGRVLDIGCGGGRWSLYLQKKGHDVLGIDISPLAAKVCKERGLRKVMLKSISEIDSSLGRFDTLLMMGTTSDFSEIETKPHGYCNAFIK